MARTSCAARSQRLDYEGEIAVIIGRGGRRIREADAWSHIAGYSCYNDGSIRDWQVATSQWTPGKNFWRTGAFGPWMVSADEIAPNQQMSLVTRLNGQEMQRASTDMMIHSIPRQIAYISAFIPLLPGDVIVTGTPWRGQQTHPAGVHEARRRGRDRGRRHRRAAQRHP
jgi:2-keto-4-pentenoate hydratase/2-oxohepta-3-ene-1,7-dioic acid hydratase in catechol pathway